MTRSHPQQLAATAAPDDPSGGPVHAQARARTQSQQRAWLNRPAAAAYLGVTVETLTQAVRCGDLTAHKFAHSPRLYFRVADLDAALKPVDPSRVKLTARLAERLHVTTETSAGTMPDPGTTNPAA